MKGRFGDQSMGKTLVVISAPAAISAETDQDIGSAVGSDQVLADRRVGSAQGRAVSAYAELSRRVQDRDLMRRRYGYYWSLMLVMGTAFVAIWVAVVLLGDSWWQLVPAAALAAVVTQFGFLGHDGAPGRFLPRPDGMNGPRASCPGPSPG